MQFVTRLPPDVDVRWFFFEDGDFAQTVRGKFPSVTIVPMSERVARAQRRGLPISAVLDSVSLIRRLTRALRTDRPDLVVTNSMKAHVLGSIAAKLAGLRCINYIHDLVDGRALDLLRLVSRVCAVERLTCSNLVKRHLRLGATTVVYASIDADAFARLPDRRESRRALGLPQTDIPIVGLVGRIARWKGQDRFIRIASYVLATHDVHFCIVGSPIFGCDDDYVTDLRDDVARRGLAHKITFVPWQETMQTVYAAVDIACNCSEREPFGRTTLEAMASRVPVVCFDDAGVCELFEQNCGGVRVPAGDERAFAAAIVDYLRSPGEREIAGEDARRTAKRTDIEHAYREFVAALERVSGSAVDGSRNILPSVGPVPAANVI